ncbi:hypothetical protein BGZ83_001053 [Gryganskiella cystojenkinii]|nr:hypothetical protein BGZ83_001053 [Gryganskiella cystojenkinii]
MFTDPKELKHLPFDILTPQSVGFMMECYAHGQGLAELLESPFAAPLKATSLAGLPPMLVYIGGSEIFRPAIEEFVRRVRSDGVPCQVELKEERCHCWFQNALTSTEADREEATTALALFLSNTHHSTH